MKKIGKLWSLSVAIVFLLASCTSTAHIEKDDTADFSRYKTFAWIEKDGQGNSDKIKNNNLTEQKIRQAVNAELEKTAGWREVKHKPDVLLSYDVLVERSSRETNSPVYSRPFTRLIYNPYTRRYTTIYYPSQFVGYERVRVPCGKEQLPLRSLMPEQIGRYGRDGLRRK